MTGPSKGWIGVDLDGTLAVYRGNATIIGEPILPMVAKVRTWLQKGYEVRIFTARVSFQDADKVAAIREEIEQWCQIHVGKRLQVTCVKDTNMVELWDDKAITVIKNTGLSFREYQKRVIHTRQRLAK